MRDYLYKRAVFRDPQFEAGCRMPSAASITAADAERRQAAEAGSRKLLIALNRYFVSGGRG